MIPHAPSGPEDRNHPDPQGQPMHGSRDGRGRTTGSERCRLIRVRRQTLLKERQSADPQTWMNRSTNATAWPGETSVVSMCRPGSVSGNSGSSEGKRAFAL